MFFDNLNLEKIFLFNFSLWGFEVVDVVKVDLEVLCFGVVLCVDILVFGVCDVVELVSLKKICVYFILNFVFN